MCIGIEKDQKNLKTWEQTQIFISKRCKSQAEKREEASDHFLLAAILLLPSSPPLPSPMLPPKTINSLSGHPRSAPITSHQCSSKINPKLQHHPNEPAVSQLLERNIHFRHKLTSHYREDGYPSAAFVRYSTCSTCQYHQSPREVRRPQFFQFPISNIPPPPLQTVP